MASPVLAPQETADDPSRMTFHELILLNLQLNGRLDALWQRVLYSHAAIVGVMVFFGTSDELYAVPRILVFAFYTANLIMTLYAFNETLTGMRAAIADLKSLQQGSARTKIQEWVFTRNYDRHATVRMAILGTTWLLLGYLLVFPLF